MYKQVDDEFRKLCIQQKGSFLKTCRSTRGGGAVLIAVAGMMLAIIILFAAIGIITLNNGDPLFSAGAAVFGAVAAVIFILLIILGFIMKKNQPEKYMDYYMKYSGYSREQLEEFDREVAEPSTYYQLDQDGLLKKINQAQARVFADHTLIVTRNWLKLNISDLLRLVDIAAIFYEKKAYYEGVQWDYVLFILTCDGTIKHFSYASKKEAVEAMLLIDLIKIRNPATITARVIQVQDQPELDCLKQPREAAQLYRSIAVDR